MKTQIVDGKNVVFDPCRRKWVSLTPEEQVRQQLIEFLSQENKYPLTMFSVEKQLVVGEKKIRYDIVIYKKESPWMLIECKSPQININQAVMNQSIAYQYVLQVPYIVLTNGLSLFCIAFKPNQQPLILKTLPVYGE